MREKKREEGGGGEGEEEKEGGWRDRDDGVGDKHERETEKK